ncbi:unnamed protein product [Symbiodinium pilosum]|uniref:Uncharacterized protein n=1 Tax=Symbiodinium pilosum TaxID=2952 RepID=A0A812UJP0_SYMPI|nr:unnamed protein product [Symbiodinium pilosum]
MEIRRDMDLGPCALVAFNRREGGLRLIGRVEATQDEFCVITSLDFWRRCAVERCVAKSQVTRVLDQGLQRARSIPDLKNLLKSSARGSEGKSCCWLPSLLAPFLICKELPGSYTISLPFR